MTAKEKANELYSKFLNKIDHLDAYWNVEKDAKELTLIAVDEVIKCFSLAPIGGISFFEKREVFWQEVKQEIENL
jgi:hypothetical protein